MDDSASASLKDFLARVRGYYSRALDAYLDHVGPTWQAGRLCQDEDEPTAEDSNLALARRAGVRPGVHLLDAGCGVAGPAVDIARGFAEVRIDGLTLGLDQAREARRRIHAAGLAERVRVTVADFHAPPFRDGVFDGVLMLESSGYVFEPLRLFSELRRVLRPGGWLYVKGVFLKEGDLSADEERERREVDAVFAHRTRPLSETLVALEATGWEQIESRHLTEISDRHFHRTMFCQPADPGAPRQLTKHGRLHYRDFQCLTAIFYHEVHARRPPEPMSAGPR